ncbi:2-amino-4-hydroxy-6-hydroxymethyldihydropteridine pyrophosphokinase [Rosistilla oblonga]|nr:2-amino-4-hydroxy-6-hydroxymethyldihydropteridine diphosphokinase [Rosistilla oblonga]QDV15003.1 2-amino-4-hydroxy-6-hydroxymethyldihydropteridine pyrophosphokinase [Rosistilla oblonga]
MPHCLISLGSNLGDRDELMRSAALAIARHPDVLAMRCSRIFTTPPVGGPSGQSIFFNAAAVIETTLSTAGVLNLLQQTEQDLGRVRKQRWDQRSIDLDVVLYGDFVGASLQLKLPHPRYTARGFVLAPAQDVAADWRDPRFGWTLRQLYEHLQAAAPSVALVGGGSELRSEICNQLSAQHGIAIRRRSASPPAMSIIGHAPGTVAATDQTPPAAQTANMSTPDNTPWVADFVPEAIATTSPEIASRDPNMPRLIARLHRTPPETRWPSPQIIYRNGWNWPEYRLEVDDLPWAVSEVAAAIDSMQCEVHPITPDGKWASPS